MPKEYFFLYLIYGSVFIIMGIFAVQKKDVEVSNFPLVKAMKYLGFFGIIHGISEWITMIVIADLYPELYVSLFIVKQILKATSFAYLIYFGFILLPIKESLKKYINTLPLILFLTWLGGFFLLINHNGMDYHILYPKYNTIWLRYIMGLSGGLSSGLALYLNAKLMEKRKLKEIAKKYKHLAYIFLTYGVLDGVFVRERDFFPANVINNTLFVDFFGFPIQIGKILLGIGINLLLIRVIETFGWEQKEKLQQLQKQKTAHEERRKLGLEIHDSIIQGLYSAGLKVEYIIKNKTGQKSELLLKEVKVDLKNTVGKTREFLASTALVTVEFEDLIDSLQQLVNKFSKSQEIKINFKSEIPSFTFRQLSPEKSTQIYYIIQEAISNVMKHSKATEAELLLYSNYDFLFVKVRDNGIGIYTDKLGGSGQLGIASMQDRAERAGGSFKLKKMSRGTMVELKVPWEG